MMKESKRRLIGRALGLGIGTGLILRAAVAADHSSELVQPPICSVATAGQPALNGKCFAKTLADGHNEVKVNLTAETYEIEVGGYKVITENYNGNYLTPVIEAMPGDTVAAHLENLLDPRAHDGMAHEDADENPTNLHYFHGGIVSPNNTRPNPAELGNGDNVYVHLKAGRDAEGSPNSFDLVVPIPGEGKLDARVLEGKGYIPHPSGLGWYHSHMHGISSDQVMGGMSGLLSVGEATANVKAGCRTDLLNPSKCLNDVAKDTTDLRRETNVRYALLRDIPLQKISKLPEEADGNATAEWAPAERDFPPTKAPGTKCGVWKKGKLDTDDLSIRTGFCQLDQNSAWLFTLNGQRFPTVTLEGGKNLLLRLGNLSANVGYWLELRNEADGTVLPLTILGLDGVVPARPVLPEQKEKPIEANNYGNLLLMPASRAEIYIRNDEKSHDKPQNYILSTRGLDAGTDKWPAIQLARIVLEPNTAASPIRVALNASVEAFPNLIQVQPPVAERAELPDGCVRDLDPTFHEYRRVTFIPGGETSTGMKTDWSILTQIVRPKVGPKLQDEANYEPDDPSKTTVGYDLQKKAEIAVPFEDYVKADGTVDWKKRHVCIFIDHGSHDGSHKQLWVLNNATATLHNFHIHQIKFRLAARKELVDIYHIEPPTPSDTCGEKTLEECMQPNIKFYEEKETDPADPGATPLWHDTIPLPAFSTVFIMMSFDATQQIGRFVFHCHILKHEDGGLMAPIEVWEPTVGAMAQ
ncbi:multicopper oxidase domain-containing protein [Mesorhizobium sp. M0983]|uniref:multicopper oxidase domain-containing protein n=1 Tax=unclassified Mesorhizobium TaxID=325217 RepID=UPI0033378516